MNHETEFLQSEEWQRFQEAAGRQVLRIEEGSLSGMGVVHTLPLVGKYLYFPRGPIFRIKNQELGIKQEIQKLTEKAKTEKVGWMRIEPQDEEELQIWKETFGGKIARAPHDMQPREVFRVGITSSLGDLLAGMKSKTRYNIRLAEKRGVKVFETREGKYQEAFLDLISATASRKEITPHPKSYHKLFFTSLPPEMCRLFVVEYKDKVLAANLVIFFGDTATYLHGGSSSEHRDAMAPYLLQWEQMKCAKREGYQYYDFGGIKTQATDSPSTSSGQASNAWEGITRFKRGFSVTTEPFLFPGTYDMVLDSNRYFLYTLLQRIKQTLTRLKRLFI